MAKNQLPEGVGKKIVEALKKQTEIELEQSKPVPVNVLANNTPAASEDIPLRPTLNYYNEEETTNSEEETLIIEDSQEDSFAEPVAPKTEVTAKLPETDIPAQLSFEDSPIAQEDARQFDIPSNVVVLRKLVNQLPPGVSKQTGAQIIRQTIEALGISMNSVLGEAQGVQDNLNATIKECAVKIQEYKTNISYLERNVQEYQKQARQINDLISLFILAENK
jgi:hypothetical protein